LADEERKVDEKTRKDEGYPEEEVRAFGSTGAV
jgi:hypothetical protein